MNDDALVLALLNKGGARGNLELVYTTATYAVNDVFLAEDRTQIEKAWDNGYVVIAYFTYNNLKYSAPVTSCFASPSNHVYSIAASTVKATNVTYTVYSATIRYRDSNYIISQISGYNNSGAASVNFDNIYYEVYKIKL